MQRLIIKTLATTALLHSLSTAQAGDVLTGDTRLACEAVLCLSSSTRPGECAPALSRYFGIKFKKPWDTVKARINFLNLCPASNEPNMPSLIEAIAHGAGQCDATFLNKYNRQTAYRTQCRKTGGWWNEETNCTTTEINVVSDNKPGYCSIYENHEYTDLATKYVGSPFHGGRWADAKDYDRELQKYNDNFQSVPSGVTYSYQHPESSRSTSNQLGREYDRQSR